MKSLLRFTGILAAWLAAGCQNSEPAILVGALEEGPKAQTGDSPVMRMRALFRRTESGWAPLVQSCTSPDCLTPSIHGFPQRVQWTVLGGDPPSLALEAVTPQTWALYADQGVQALLTQPEAARPRTMTFAGWPGVPVVAPLIATTAPSGLPQQWDAVELSEDMADRFRVAFVDEFPQAINCNSPEGNDTHPRTVTAGEVVIRRAHAAPDDWTVATMNLPGLPCDFVAEGPYAQQTFAASPSGEVTLLGDGLLFVDSGDFDGDGEVEVLLSVDRYNRGGYELWYDGFTRHSVFEYSYH
jgi:hypothetical protein